MVLVGVDLQGQIATPTSSVKCRGDRDHGLGGTFHIDNLFSGDNSPFFLSYKLNENIQLISELSSDNYHNEISSSKGFTQK